MSNFFEELKRRKVYRTAVAYAAVSFVIMQIVEIIFPMFEIPLWMGRFVIILIVLGFPVAMILSWMFDKSADGITRDKGQSSSNFSSTKPFYLQKQNIIIIAVLLVGIFIGRFASSTNEKKSLVNPKSVAVLPFDNYSTAPEDQYFSDGMTEVIIANLAKIKDLKVISRTSVMEYKKTTKNIKEIAVSTQQSGGFNLDEWLNQDFSITLDNYSRLVGNDWGIEINDFNFPKSARVPVKKTSFFLFTDV